MKGKREKEIYTQLNAEFQTMQNIEENNRMGMIRDLTRKLEISAEYFMQR